MSVAVWLTALLGLDWHMGSEPVAADWVMVSRAEALAPDWGMLSPSLPVQPRQIPQQRAGYPVRGGHWSIGSQWNASRSTVMAHLQDGVHAGKWDPAWLATLSRDELLSLHDDDHEGRVQWAHVRRPTTAPRPTVQPAYRSQPASQTAKTTRGVVRLFARPSGQTCPGGRCPR